MTHEQAAEATGPAPDWTPTTGEVERAWCMRQFALDVEAGREPNIQQYGAEFRRWLAAHEKKVGATKPTPGLG